MKYVLKTLYALFILALVGVAGLFVTTLLPIPGNIEVKIVKSGSMEPSILTGSVVVVKPEESYAVGDVITFGRDTRTEIPTTHRIVEVLNDSGRTSFVTKGDANEDRDPGTTLLSAVIGKVVIAVPYAGYILDFARKPLGFTLMIGVPAGLIIVDEVLRIVLEIQKLRAKRRDEDEVALAFRDLPAQAGEQHTAPVRPVRHFDIPKPHHDS